MMSDDDDDLDMRNLIIPTIAEVKNMKKKYMKMH